ncbi:hypothetical protein MMC22_006371 [Lobaria immixta]|nr:hypothetical protein [Lobaria immixta]
MATLATQPMRSVYFNQNRSSFIDSALKSMRVIIPLLFLVTLFVTGTMAISANFITHQPLPPHFTLGVSITFGLLMTLTAVLLLWFLKRRFNKKRAAINADLEAKIPRRSARGVGTRSQSKGRAPHQDGAAINVDLEANRPRQSARVVRTSSQSRGPALRLQIPRHVSTTVGAVPIKPEPAYIPCTSKLPFTAANYEVNPQLLHQPLRTHRTPPVIQKPTRTCSRRRSKRKVGTRTPRKRGPPPTKDHAAFHLPVQERPLFPSATAK